MNPFADTQILQDLMRIHWADLLEAAPDGMMLVDARGRIVFCNRHGERIFRYEPGELVGKGVDVLVPESLRGSHEVHVNRYAAAPYARPMGKALDLVGVCKDGHELPVEISLSPLSTPHGTLMVAAVRDMSQHRYTAQVLSAMATTDALTGLANKALFHDRLEQAISDAQRYKRRAAVILLDLDLFKRVNESFGHEGGDMVLMAVAQRLKAHLSEQATLARLGGDEYAILLRDLSDVSDLSAAAKTAQSLLEALAAEPFEIEGQEFVLTASAGISNYPDDGTDASTLLQHAERAMYRAKTDRNSYQHFDREAMTHVVERLTLESSLRKAIEQGELLIHYQPQVTPGDGRIVGAEALIRWNHPQHGLVSPAQFIPLAEETGLIVPITEWVLATACRQALEWRAAGLPPIRMAINLSAQHFKHLALVETVRKLLDQTGFDAAMLDLELTESLLMENLDVAVAMLEQLSALGVRLSIDDFGTGYSSLSYLKRLPIHALKIDRSFIRDLDSDRSSAAIVRAIIDLAHHLDLEVVAEGVEDAPQLDQLRRLGCDEIQGFYYSRPLAPAAFAELLARDPFRQERSAAG
jgi:diguanylate cyclase (GGDEF)-like protein/PAS domain S-box-containing protein